jgi:hypothetical protein
MASEAVQVECYSGHSYAQEPRAFTWHGQRRVIIAVEQAWRAPFGPCFRVRTEDGACFELAYDEHTDKWGLDVVKGRPRSTGHLDKESHPAHATDLRSLGLLPRADDE